VLQTVQDHKKALTELNRILKPGGVLVLSTLRSPSIWELPLFPAVELMMCDHSILTGQWYPRLIKDRDGLIWHNRPRENRARRYKMDEITGCLHALGFNDVRHYYLGRIRKIPILMNSQLVTFLAVKSKQPQTCHE
jgi:ubiquinone/menaquinone biosynthesis C-methylase UbiE